MSGTILLIYNASNYFKAIEDSLESIERNFSRLNDKTIPIEVGTKSWRLSGLRTMKKYTFISIGFLVVSYLIQFILLYAKY